MRLNMLIRIAAALALLCLRPVCAEEAVYAGHVVAHADLPSKSLTPRKVTVWLPPGYEQSAERYPTLYVNDGQEMQAVELERTLARLYRAGSLQKLIVVAIDAAERMDTYGLSDRAQARSVPIPTHFGIIGTRAHDYSNWLTSELVPYIDAHYRTKATQESRAILGWSLGALHAFNVVWQYPELFGRLGAFSPSFWVAADRSTTETVQKTRLVHRLIDVGSKRQDLKMWFAVGSAEETDDRDNDGIIDAVDDLRDAITGYNAGDGFATRGLVQLGYVVNLGQANGKEGSDVAFHLQTDGQHNQSTWARMLPEFLLWVFPK